MEKGFSSRCASHLELRSALAVVVVVAAAVRVVITAGFPFAYTVIADLEKYQK
jgi:hypothetical protein